MTLVKSPSTDHFFNWRREGIPTSHSCFRMKSEKQRETLNKGQFPSLELCAGTEGTDAGLTPSRLIPDPDLGSMNTQAPSRPQRPCRLNTRHIPPSTTAHLLALILWLDVAQPFPERFSPSPGPRSLLPRLHTPASGSAQTLGPGGVLWLYQLMSSSCGRSQQETKPSLCFLHRHSKAQKSKAK